MDASYLASLADAVEACATGRFDTWTTLYATEGGSLIIASPGSTTDCGRPHDLAVVLPAPLGGRRVLPLSIATNPDLIDGLERELAAREAVAR